MNQEDIFPTPPEAPPPTLRSRIYSSPYFWWILTFPVTGNRGDVDAQSVHHGCITGSIQSGGEFRQSSLC